MPTTSKLCPRLCLRKACQLKRSDDSSRAHPTSVEWRGQRARAAISVNFPFPPHPPNSVSGISAFRMLSSHFILCREGICRSRGVAHGGRLVCPDGLSLITARRSCMASLHYTVWVISVWRNDYPQLCSRDGEPTHAAPPPRLALMLVVLPHCHWTVGPVSPAWSLADGSPVVFPLKTGRSPISPQEAPRPSVLNGEPIRAGFLQLTHYCCLVRYRGPCWAWEPAFHPL